MEMTIRECIDALKVSIAYLEKLEEAMNGPIPDMSMDRQIPHQIEQFEQAWKLEKSNKKTQELLNLERMSME
jgi:hypothetical protein